MQGLPFLAAARAPNLRLPVLALLPPPPRVLAASGINLPTEAAAPAKYGRLLDSWCNESAHPRERSVRVLAIQGELVFFPLQSNEFLHLICSLFDAKCNKFLLLEMVPGVKD